MRSSIAMVATLAMMGTACAGGADGNAANGTNTAAGNAATSGNSASAAATYDPNSEQGRAYRAVLECGATMQAASSIIGGVSMSKSGAERDAYLADERQRRTHAAALRDRAIELGAALGLSREAVEQQFTAHEGTFVQTQASGSMDQFGATVAAQANACARNYPDIVRQ